MLDETKDAEGKVKSFYETDGWTSGENGVTTDAQLFEDLRDCAKEYVSACRKKLLTHLPKNGDFFLDAASGPIQYPEYLEYSAGFKKRVCVDISSKALKLAAQKLGEKGETVCASLTNLPFHDAYFDAAVSLHTIYHIDASEQEKAVHELLRVTKTHAPIVIIYSNPNRLLARLARAVGAGKPQSTPRDHLYFYSYPLSWWKRFENQAEVKILPWRFLTASDSKRFIPNYFLGRTLLRLMLKIENHFPNFSAAFGAYPMIVLNKRR